jgi:hypothetical protein
MRFLSSSDRLPVDPLPDDPLPDILREKCRELVDVIIASRDGSDSGGGSGNCSGAGDSVSGVGVRRKFGILLVLRVELALDDLGLGATAGALKPLDVLVILVGCLNCLQLRVCDLKESGFIWLI